MKKTKKYSTAYLRWKTQRIALKHNDLFTVKKLADEAREYFMLQRSGNIQLRLS